MKRYKEISFRSTDSIKTRYYDTSILDAVLTFLRIGIGYIHNDHPHIWKELIVCNVVVKNNKVEVLYLVKHHKNYQNKTVEHTFYNNIMLFLIADWSEEVNYFELHMQKADLLLEAEKKEIEDRLAAKKAEAELISQEAWFFELFYPIKWFLAIKA